MIPVVSATGVGEYGLNGHRYQLLSIGCGESALFEVE